MFKQRCSAVRGDQHRDARPVLASDRPFATPDSEANTTVVSRSVLARQFPACNLLRVVQYWFGYYGCIKSRGFDDGGTQKDGTQDFGRPGAYQVANKSNEMTAKAKIHTTSIVSGAHFFRKRNQAGGSSRSPVHGKQYCT